VSLITVTDVDVHYGDLQAIFGFSMDLPEGQTLAIIGANGAGKSTVLKTIAGQITPTRGTVMFDGVDITAMPDYRRVAMGIALTPEGRRIFKSLSVEENLQVGGFRKRKGPWNLKSVYAAFPLVADRRQRSGANLSGGEAQAVAIGRALMSNPRLLLLDEVSLGLAPVAIEQVYAALPTIKANGTTVLLVEQDVNQALRVADRVQCLLEGRVVLTGTPGSISRDDIAAAYFGI
jgi:branched-chain amino acid transport system ATP-binding protein